MKRIESRRDLREWLRYEKNLYNLTWFDYITLSEMYYCWTYVKLLRKCEFYRNSKYWLLFRPFFIFCRRKKNRVGIKTGMYIGENCIGKGLQIYHAGYIVLNGKASIGENFKLHGCNCVGNNGINLDAPIIGNNVEMGFGSCIIGGITIADNVKIGANTTVLEDCSISGTVLVGVKARHVIH